MRETFRLIYSDYRRYRAIGGTDEGSLLGIILLTQGFWASTVYRLAHYITLIRPFIVRRVLRILFLFIEKWVEIITSIRIPGDCVIGKGLYIGHFGPIVVHSQAKIGDFCNLSQGVTIGGLHQGERKGVPVIGNRVYIGPNAIVIGGITVGDDVAIGAGAVVVRSVLPRGIVAGNPAHLISRKGSFGLVNYDNMRSDPVRNTSLKLVEMEEQV
jgi:serine O-acetyltransferase